MPAAIKRILYFMVVAGTHVLQPMGSDGVLPCLPGAGHSLDFIILVDTKAFSVHNVPQAAEERYNGCLERLEAAEAAAGQRTYRAGTTRHEPLDWRRVHGVDIDAVMQQVSIVIRHATWMLSALFNWRVYPASATG